MRSFVPPCGAALWLAASASLLGAQDLPAPGLRLESAPDPAASPFAASTALESGEVVAFDGEDVVLYDAGGAFLRLVASLPGPVFPSFLVAAPGEEVVYVGESTSHGIHRVPLAPGSTPELFATLTFNYDAAMHAPDALFVSAATCGFGCGNEIWRVDVASHVATRIATVPGASGPLAFDRAGRLYYGTAPDAFPPPPNPSSIHRWSAMQLASGALLTLADAELVGSGFAGAARLATDRRAGTLLLLENNFATGENRLRLVLGPAAASPVLVEGEPFRAMGNLSVHSGPGPALWRPFQPEAGGRVGYTTTDFASVAERATVLPLRPTLTLTGPGTQGPGTFFASLEGGPPDGSAIVLLGARADALASERAVVELGAAGRLPLLLGLGRRSLAALPGRLALDGSGEVFQPYDNPGGLEGSLAMQLLLFDAAGRAAGTSETAFL
jgi:hypothetical protein